jgi:hypothetical protein
MARNGAALAFSGRSFDRRELALIQEVVGSCGGLSRMELAHTVCELLGWTRSNGGLKARECREFLERLEAEGVLRLPAKRAGKPVGTRTRVPVTAQGEVQPRLVASVSDVQPIQLVAVASREERLLFRELVGRHHYLGYAVPFGAQMQYLVYGCEPERRVLACLQFLSAAWRMAARDQWIGWGGAARERNLPRVVNNSRFLIMPWVEVPNLASTILSLAARRLKEDWPRRYGTVPLLLETLVDPVRYRGGCYRAANWQEVGVTSGRGRMDREHLRHQAAPKIVFVYALARDARRKLQER